jgi:hypothetical protein
MSTTWASGTGQAATNSSSSAANERPFTET